MNSKILNVSLWAGVAYFCCMAVAHFLGLKYPLVFVYYDVPFYAYQDKIIAFAVVAYICLFYTAATIRAAVPAALVALAMTVLGLSALNLSDALQSVLAGRPTTMYWVQVGAIAGYLVWLLVFHLRAKGDAQGSRSAGFPAANVRDGSIRARSRHSRV